MRRSRRLTSRGVGFIGHIMRGLKAMYRVAAAQRRGPGASGGGFLRAQTMLEMDRLMVAPRFGFRDPLDYYAQASVAPGDWAD